jgi:hypothetical protein
VQLSVWEKHSATPTSKFFLQVYYHNNCTNRGFDIFRIFALGIYGRIPFTYPLSLSEFPICLLFTNMTGSKFKKNNKKQQKQFQYE